MAQQQAGKQVDIINGQFKQPDERLAQPAGGELVILARRSLGRRSEDYADLPEAERRDLAAVVVLGYN